MKQLIVSGKMPHGLVLEGTTYQHFELREALLADMIEAEVDSGGVGNSLHYNAQLLARQLVRVHDNVGNEFNGPFVVSMIKKRGDFLALREKQLELDDMGNAELNDSVTTGSQSS